MARHAGFAAVATVGGELINQVMAAYVERGPMFFPAPTTIPLATANVTFAGVFEMLHPKIDLQPNPGNLVTLQFTFRSSLRSSVQATVLGGPSVPERQYDVELRGAVTLAPITSIQNDQLQVGINTASVNFAPLTVVTLTGPALPAVIKQVLQSPVLAAIASAFVQNRPNIMLTHPTLRTVLERVQPGDFPDVGTSIFNWFTIRLEASRIVVKPLGVSMAIAVDFRGWSSGDPNQLVDLRSGDDVWAEIVTPDVAEQQGPPYIVPRRSNGGGNVGVVFNMGVLSRIVDSISKQTAHTRISQNVELRGLSAGYSTFRKPLYPGQRDGLRLGFDATVHPTDLNVSGAVYMQMVVTVFDGPTAFLRADSWALRAVHSELDTAWWVDVVVFAISAIAGAILPGLFPVFATAAIAVTDGILPGLLSNARNAATRGVEKGLLGLGLPSPEEDHPLPALPGASWNGKIVHVAVTPDDIHSVLNLSVASNDKGSKIVTFEGWHAEYRRPMAFSLKLSPRMEGVADNLWIVWQVFRTDDNTLLRTVNRRYLGDDVLFQIDPKATVRGAQLDPETNGILIGLRDKDYYFLNAVKVRATVTARLGGQTGNIWSSEIVVAIDENLDRHHKFVQWGPHQVFFINAGTNGEVWNHNRSSRIHRTATGSRCQMLRQRASAVGRKRPKFRYFDILPHKWQDLSEHRHFLCEYCFFGGPDKTVLFPQEDWF